MMGVGDQEGEGLEMRGEGSIYDQRGASQQAQISDPGRPVTGGLCARYGHGVRLPSSCRARPGLQFRPLYSERRIVNLIKSSRMKL